MILQSGLVAFTNTSRGVTAGRSKPGITHLPSVSLQTLVTQRSDILTSENPDRVQNLWEELSILPWFGSDVAISRRRTTFEDGRFHHPSEVYLEKIHINATISKRNS